MSDRTVKVTIEFTEDEVEDLRPFFYIEDELEMQLTNFIWETIYEKTNIDKR